jgi:nitroimidazol reductase NimA-like FMN-containing flavoprotein (pyridoxamine 5'-phosphate oxidase superfamily)
MPSRRDQIAMTPDEVRAYLRSQPRLIVCSNGTNGFPHPVPMNFAVDNEDRLLIITFGKSQKVKNLERDPRASLLVESGHAYHELKSVMIYAMAEIISERAAFDAAKEAFVGKIQTQVFSKDAQEQAQATMPKRVIVRFTPERTISWDHAKLQGQY